MYCSVTMLSALTIEWNLCTVYLHVLACVLSCHLINENDDDEYSSGLDWFFLIPHYSSVTVK